MKKKLLLLIFTIFTSVLFCCSVSADTTCKYMATNKNGKLTITFTILQDKKGKYYLEGDECIVDGYVVSDDRKYIEQDDELVDNWEKTQQGESISGRDYFTKEGKCPPYAVFTDESAHFNVHVSTKDDLGIFANYAREKQGYEILELVDQNLVGKSYTINFVNTISEATGTMNSIKATYGTSVHIPETGFKLYGYKLVGYKVKNNGKWLCGDGTYQNDCKNYQNYEIVGSDTMVDIKFDQNYPVVDLHTEWKINSAVSSQIINQYNLGESFCTGSGFVWIEKNGGYCNTDKLQFVTCGDSYDIPIELPQLISYFVNILKIATPLILIVISMISLLKAMASSTEDDIKKAQKGLIRKIIAAVMVFFVINIVQFVVLTVADSSETKSVSNCMSCFLNNDCINTTYYKTNIGGVYYCTKVLDTGTDDIKSCIEFYDEVISDFKSE